MAFKTAIRPTPIQNAVVPNMPGQSGFLVQAQQRRTRQAAISNAISGNLSVQRTETLFDILVNNAGIALDLLPGSVLTVDILPKTSGCVRIKKPGMW